MKFKTEKTGRIMTAVLFAVLLAVCAAVTAGCGAYPLIQRVSNAVGIERRHTGSDPDMIKVLLAETDGITVDSENPVYVPGGSDVTFEYTLKEGYTFDGIIAPEGAEISDGKIKLTGVRYPSTVIIESRPLRTCKIETAVSDYGDGAGDAAGAVVCTPTVLTEGEEAVLIAESAKYFSFVSYTAGKPASEGGEVISESKIFNYRPSDSVTVYANFLRTSAPVTLLPNDGILNKSVPVIDLPLGKSGFFVIEEKEGFEITSIPDNTTLDRGLLTVTGVTGPTVLEIGTRMLAKYSLDVTLTDKNAGTVERSPAQSSGWEGTEVMLKAETNRGYTFDGYSLTLPLSAGGGLLTSNPEYMFTLDGDTRIFANFTQRKYTVTLKLSDGASLASGETTVTVISGESAEFPVTVENGYEFGYVTGGATYTDGIVRLGEVFEDTEIEFEAHKKAAIKIEFLSSESALGYVTGGSGFYIPGSNVSASAITNNSSFRGWSVGKPYSSGGRIVSTSPVYSFSASSSLTVYANFIDPAETAAVPSSQWIIYYHPNGGVNASTNSGSMRTERVTHTVNYSAAPPKTEVPYRCPNALPDENYFKREGYQLLGYNTASDGSGKYYAPGWNIIMPERGAVSLYCVWVPETPASDFSYSRSSNQITVLSYKGNDKTVVIPENIDGYPVTAISGACIASRDIETLVIPKTVKKVSASAVLSCPSFKRLYLHDTVTSMPDSWVTNCPEFSELRIMAAHFPTTLTGRNGTYCVKMEYLQLAKGRKIMVVAGSNVAYGLNAPMLEQLMAENGYEYSVINFGQNANNCQMFFIEVISHFCNPGDILVVAPEIYKNQFGYSGWYGNTQWSMVEGAYEYISYIDTRHYPDLFSTFASFNSSQANAKRRPYETFTTDTVNAWGDYALGKVGATSSWNTTLQGYDDRGGYGSQTYSAGAAHIKNTTYNKEINRVYDMCKAAGARVYFTFPAVVKTCLTKAAQTDGGSDQQTYIDAVKQYLHVTIISKPADYQFARQYSYNSNWHINTAGQTIRTQNLCRDIIAQLKKGG